MSERIVTATAVIPATAQQIFDLLADPDMHAMLDGSGTVKASHPSNPERLSLGAKFGMDMKIGLPYKMSNEVVEFDEPRRIAWRHVGNAVWAYELEPVEGGTKVTETWDYRPLGPLAFSVELAGFPKRNAAGMQRTLAKLAEHFAAA